MSRKIFFVLLIVVFVNAKLLFPSTNLIMNGTLTPKASFLGMLYKERVGYVLSTAGDVNGDGYDDFMIGTFHHQTGGIDAGAVYLLLGRPIINWGMKYKLSDANARFLGEQNYEAVGFSITGGGDVNGDGYDDMIIGAPAGNDLVRSRPGKIYVVLGKASADWSNNYYLANGADASYKGQNSQDIAGRSVAIINDLNGDGCDEILCGAPYNDYGAKDAGKVYLVLGKFQGWNRDETLDDADASFYYAKEYGNCGFSVSAAGDVNHDGISDFIIGAPGISRVFVIFGRQHVSWGQNFDLKNADLIIMNDDPFRYDLLGYNVAGIGDVNGDHISDMLIAAINNSQGGYQAGKVYLVLGRSGGWNSSEFSLVNTDASFIGERTVDQAGWSIGSAGDVNGDGYDDFLIGAWKNNYGYPEAGKGYLIYGKSTGWQKDVDLAQIPTFFSGELDTNYAGYAVSRAGDINGDQWSDYIISASYNDEVSQWSGQVYLFSNQRPKHIISGYVNYYNSYYPVPNTLVNIESNRSVKDTTDNNGYYQFEAFEQSNYKVFPFKTNYEDVGEDCISAYDAALIARYCVGLETLVDPFLTSADIDRNDKVTAYDAALILQYSLGYPPSPHSYAGEWIFIPDTIFIADFSSNYNDQNFNALIRGDVNADWYSHNRLTKKYNTTNYFDKIISIQENKLIVPIEFNRDNQILSLDIQLQYNTTNLQFLNIEKCEIAKDFHLDYYVTDEGIIKIGAFTISPLNQGGTFIKIIFTYTRDADVDDYITINKLRINDGKIMSYIISLGNSHNISFQLKQNYPNPFNGITEIKYQIAQPCKVTLSIFNTVGQEIYKLTEKKNFPGSYSITWHGTNQSGEKVATGVYICQALLGNITQQIKLLYIK